MEIDTTSSTIKVESIEVKRHTTNDRPKSLDLTGKITEPVNQGLCGSCWGITTTQCLRDRINAKRKKPIPPLSFQFVIDCSKHCISFRGRTGCALDCDGGFLATSYMFLMQTGTPRENYHPNRHVNERGEDHIDGTVGNKAPCPRKVDPDEPLYKADGFYNVHIYPDTFGITNARTRPLHKTPEQLRANADNIAEEIYQNGVVAVCFNLYSDFKPFWQHPDCGKMVYELGWQLPAEARASIPQVGDTRWTESSGPHGLHFKTGHSISLCGYGTQRGVDGTDVDYWICRNSWGQAPQSYNKGYFKIRRGVNCSAIEGDVCAPYVSSELAQSMAASPEPPLAPSSAHLSHGVRTHHADPAVVFVILAAIVFLLIIIFRP